MNVLRKSFLYLTENFPDAGSSEAQILPLTPNMQTHIPLKFKEFYPNNFRDRDISIFLSEIQGVKSRSYPIWTSVIV